LQSSNLKHVLDLTGFPMLAGNGVTPPMGTDGKPQTLKIGPCVVCFAPPQPGLTTMPNWQFIELQGGAELGTPIALLRGTNARIADQVIEQNDTLAYGPKRPPAGACISATCSAQPPQRYHIPNS
jgi:hypothetical protein